MKLRQSIINMKGVIVFSVFYMLGIGLLVYLKLMGTEEVALIAQHDRLLMVPLIMASAFLLSVVMGVLEFRLFRKWGHYHPVRFFIYKYNIIVTVIIAGEILVFSFFVQYIDPSRSLMREALDYIPSGTFLSVFIYLLLFSLALNVLGTISSYLGPETALNALIGRYSEPVEESLTFIFIDLKGSTGMAEHLGHKHYSQLIDRCFTLLTECIYQYKASLYQFVGDEAVLFWKMESARKDSAPLGLYFEFCRKLEAEQRLFIEQYGVFPEFRAAVHEGVVAVKTIQSVKKDIVYHGDVLNTCARIMGLCSKYNVKLLVSVRILEWLKNDPKYEISLADQVVLRGKADGIGIYTVSLTRHRK